MYGRLETCGRLSIGLSGVRRTLMLSVAYALLRAVSGILPTLRSRVSTNRRVPPRFLDLVVQALACAHLVASACANLSLRSVVSWARLSMRREVGLTAPAKAGATQNGRFVQSSRSLR